MQEGRKREELEGSFGPFLVLFLALFPLNVCKLDYSFLRKGKLLLDSRIFEEEDAELLLPCPSSMTFSS